MSNSRGPDGRAGRRLIYQIRIRGHLGHHWADRFGTLSMTLEDNGTTLLTGPVPDQAALYGILRKIRDLGVELLSVNSVEAGTRDLQEGG